jgi:STE24 endopeptidase
MYSHFMEPLSGVLKMGLSAVSRRFEFQADRFSVDNTGDGGATMKAALLKLQKENMGSVTPDWLYAACHYSHPPLPERLAAIDAHATAAAATGSGNAAKSKEA